MSFTSKSLTSLVKGGNINVFQLEGNNNYVLVLAFTNKEFVVPLLNTGKGYTSYVSRSYSEEEFEYINTFMKDYFAAGYRNLPQFGHCLWNDPTRAFSKAVVRFIQGRWNKAKDAITDKILTDHGYDISALRKTINVSTKKRDYSELLEDPDAKDRFEMIANALKKMGASLTTMDTSIQVLFHAIQQGQIDGAIFRGPAGTGKTVLAYVLSNAMGAPLLTFQATSGMQVEDVNGQYIPSESPDKQYEYCIGLILKAYCEGYQVVIDESNMAPPDVMSVINQFKDDTPSITINNKVYKRHPNFVLYLTMNPGYEGTLPLNPALKSRFPVVAVDRITEPVFVERLMGWLGTSYEASVSVDFLKAMFAFQNYITPFAPQYGENIEFSIRNAKYFLSFILGKECNLAEFTEGCHMAYINALSLDNDNTNNVANLKSSPEIKEKITHLFSLYDYRQIDAVDVSSSFEDTLDVTPVASTSSRKFDDFDDEDIDILSSLETDMELSSLLKEETTPAPEVEEAEDVAETTELDEVTELEESSDDLE